MQYNLPYERVQSHVHVGVVLVWGNMCMHIAQYVHGLVHVLHLVISH